MEDDDVSAHSTRLVRIKSGMSAFAVGVGLTSVTGFILFMFGVLTFFFYLMWSHLRWVGVLLLASIAFVYIYIGKSAEFMSIMLVNFVLAIPYIVLKIIEVLVTRRSRALNQ